MSEPSPYARALSDFWEGARDATYEIHRDDGYTATIHAADSFASPPFDPIEEHALDQVMGRVLDVGAGVGRHTLVLQARGYEVRAIDAEPTLVRIMSERGVVDARAERLAAASGAPFDTILLLMNGLGLIGTTAGAGPFFAHARGLLASGGQILCDSLDVRPTVDARHLAYQQANVAAGRPPGQMRFRIATTDRHGDWFDWLHLDFDGLRRLADIHGWSAEKLHEDGGHYLARLRPARMPFT